MIGQFFSIFLLIGNKKIFDLSMIPAFSAQNFIAGRASFMQNNILQLLEKHKTDHFHPELLKDLVNQSYELCDYFKPDMMQKQLLLRGFAVKFDKATFLGKTIFIPKIKGPNQNSWHPAHFLGMRHKMQKNLDTIDKGIIDLILKKAVIVVGNENDQKTLNYAFLISQIHTVIEHRFCPIAKKPKKRIRETLDAWLINSVTEKISFKMITGADITNVLEHLEYFSSFDNKTSFYNCYVSPISRKFLCFSWRGLILTYLVPVFGLCNSPATNETFMVLLRLEMNDLLTTLDLEDYIFMSTCWIDDSLIATKMGSFMPYNFSPTLLIYALLAIQVGVTLNIQKSTFKNVHEIEYLGLKLSAKTKKEYAKFAVREQVVIEVVGFLLSIFECTDSHWQDVLLSQLFTEIGWEALNHRIKKEILQQNLSYKNIEQAIGKLGWINRNNTIDVQVIHIELLYRSNLAWKQNWIVNAAKIELFNLPKLISEIINIPQLPNPLELDYFVNLDWCTKKHKTKKDWFGIPPMNLSGLFAWQEPISSKTKIWIKDGILLENTLQKIQDDVVSATTKNLSDIKGFFTIDQKIPFIGETMKGRVTIAVKIINSEILSEPQKITKTNMMAFRMLTFWKNILWNKLGIAVKMKIIRHTPKLKPNTLSYWQPTEKWFKTPIWKTEETVCLFKNEILHPNLATVNGFSIAWQLKGALTPHFATVNHMSFWDALRTEEDNIRMPKVLINTVLINSEERKIIRRIVQIIYNKPKSVSILWPFFNKKLLRLVSLMLHRLEPIILFLPANFIMVYKSHKWTNVKQKAIPTLIFPGDNT